MSSWGNEVGIMRERVVCDTDRDHLQNKEVEQEKIVSVPHIPKKEGRMWE